MHSPQIFAPLRSKAQNAKLKIWSNVRFISPQMWYDEPITEKTYTHRAAPLAWYYTVNHTQRDKQWHIKGRPFLFHLSTACHEKLLTQKQICHVKKTHLLFSGLCYILYTFSKVLTLVCNCSAASEVLLATCWYQFNSNSARQTTAQTAL